MSFLNTVQRFLPPLARLPRKMNYIPSVLTKAHFLTPPAVIPPSSRATREHARRSAARDSLELHTIPLLADAQTRSSKNRVTWILKFTLPAPSVAGYSPIFCSSERVWSKWCTGTRRGGTLRLSLQTINIKLQHFSLTLTSSPCLIMLHSTAQSGLKLSRVVHSRVHQTMAPLGRPSYLWSQGPRLPGNRQTALPSPSLRDTFVANSRSINSLPSLMLGMQRMTRNWMPLPLTPSSHSICWLWARTSERQTFFSGHYGHRQGPIQKLLRGCLPPGSRYSFFHRCTTKG